jgi:hypothetical protein
MLTKRQERGKWTLAEAVFSEMLKAAEMASGGGRYVFPQRNLFYSVRDLISRYEIKGNHRLTWKYFEGALLESWERAHGRIPGMYTDPRGFLVEPHTGTVVPLGTLQVESYRIPAWQYDKILFVEKKGFHEMFKAARLAEKYDMAIICSEGYAVDAAKLLLSRIEQSMAVIIFCLHDADAYGKNIARKLAEASKLQTTINVVDIGLSLREAEDMGLTIEPFYRTKEIPAALELDDLERKYFKGIEAGRDEKGKPRWKCGRVELNALAADPERFLRYVEDKLVAHGCGTKLVPPAQVVRQAAGADVNELLQERLRAFLHERLGFDTLVEKLAGDLAGKVPLDDLHPWLTRWGQGVNEAAWARVLRNEVGGRVDEVLSDRLVSVNIDARLKLHVGKVTGRPGE